MRRRFLWQVFYEANGRNPRFGAMLVLVAMACTPALAERLSPDPVPPLVCDGRRFEAPNVDGRTAYLQAWDEKTGHKLWEIPVFENRIEPGLEEDVQWVFIKSIAVRDDRLMISSERGATYFVDPQTGRVLALVLPLNSRNPTMGLAVRVGAVVIVLAITTAVWKLRRRFRLQQTPDSTHTDRNSV
jgi:hypothetical protein